MNISDTLDKTSEAFERNETTIVFAAEMLKAVDIGEEATGRAAAGVVAFNAFCHGLALQAGWWNGVNKNDPNVIGWKLALVHSEINEALEGMRNGKMDDHLPHRLSIEVALADAVIRIMDLCGALDLDLTGAIIEKLAYNTQRPDHKPAARAADGGKKV